MRIDVKMRPFRFPNFLIPECVANMETDGLKLSVGALTDEQAATLWDDMKPLWLAHVAKKRQQREGGQ